MSRLFYMLAFGMFGALIGLAGVWYNVAQPCAIVYSERVERFDADEWTHRIIIDAERLDQSCSPPDVMVMVRLHGAVMRLPKDAHGRGVFLSGTQTRAEIAIPLRLPLQVSAVQTGAHYTDRIGMTRPAAFSKFAEGPQP